MSNFDINILVNGSRCKQYHHQGRTFIEAKDGSEYSIEIKNNNWKRILACCSVDGLNILNGKTATNDGPGYVINGYSSNRYDGFRVSDTQVAKFVFGNKKGESYASSKGDGSEKNVGVIGVRIFDEFIKPVTTTSWSNRSIIHTNSTGDPVPTPHTTIWVENNFPVADCCCGDDLDAGLYCCDDIPVKGKTTSVKISSTKGGGIICAKSVKSQNTSTKGVENERKYTRGICALPDPEIFDMSTKWGNAKESRIVEVEFERGMLTLTMDIYYASRQNLIELGVPIGNEKQVNFPSAFAESKYAQPPKNWNG
jgi:hypothetical protein